METPVEQNHLNICIIEENELVRKTVKETLTRFARHADIKVSDNHGDGLTMIAESDFDVILINEGRPNSSSFSGSKICFLIKELSPKSRIVLMSGFKKKEKIPSTVDYFLEKPFTHQELMSAVLLT